MGKLINRFRPLLRHVAPAAKVIEAATNVLGQLKEPTMFGITNAVAGGLRSLSEVVDESDNGKSYHYETMVSGGLLAEAARRAGADLVEERSGNQTSWHAYFGEHSAQFNVDGDVWFACHPTKGPGEWLRKALDAVLPPVLHVFINDGNYEVAEVALTQIEPIGATRIWECTRGMLEGGRAILLDGRPGTGKTVTAQAIARDSGLGRVLVIDPTVVNPSNHAGYFSPFMLGLMSAGVIIVDDIDKIQLELNTLELLRSKCRLLILTANNGQYDEVLDAALMRPARVDEVFTVVPQRADRHEPFDQLSDDQWSVICDWPVAYMNEVERRLRARPDDLRLDDLAQRLQRKTRSKGALH